jgi:hypothetical protein
MQIRTILCALLFLICNIHGTNVSEIPILATDPSVQRESLFDKLSVKALYCGMGTMLGSLSLGAKLAGKIYKDSLENECLLFSALCSSAAKHVFSQIAQNTPMSLFKGVHPSFNSWLLNKTLLSQIPVYTEENERLLLFLEKRWLAKTAGVYSSMIKWFCPCFGISVQIHPETTNSYARDPWNKLSETYRNRVAEWKRSLPHPRYYPLILTRPFDLQGYLPSSLEAPVKEEIKTTVARLANQKGISKRVVDLTRAIPSASNPKKWLQAWNAYRSEFIQECQVLGLKAEEIVCIQRLRKDEVGGIRILPLVARSAKEAEPLHQFLLEWVSKFGISANRIELDRWTDPEGAPSRKRSPTLSNLLSLPWLDLDKFVSKLPYFDKKWKSSCPQKTLMFKGTMQTLKGLFSQLSLDQRAVVFNCPTRSSIARLSFFRINQELAFLDQKGEEISFYDMASHLEQIHAHLTALLEIFSPFAPGEFQGIYLDRLASLPEPLKPLTSCGVHSTGMTSLSGIIKAVKEVAGRRPRVLYGENIYFENIRAFELSSEAKAAELATVEDWQETDLILAEFNPALKRIDYENTLYRVERIADMLRAALNARQGKPLTLALDCTLDYIDSPRVGSLLSEFSLAIEQGDLNVICYHSGIKFDLFGMDNYSGAPFFMVHSEDPKWAPFGSLLSDPVLQTDRLSYNWFCLAYKNAAPLLNLYRKEVFDRTRALLNKVPKRLFENKDCVYRIIPIDLEADPGFLDIKIFGPAHKLKASLIGGLLTMKCMEAKHPIFYRPSLGFYHPNLSLLYGEDRSTIRLTLGLDPSQVDIFAECFEIMDALNQPKEPGTATYMKNYEGLLLQHLQ